MIYFKSLKAFWWFYELVEVDLYGKGHTRKENLVGYNNLEIDSL